MRQTVRKVLSWLLFSAVGVILLGLLTEWFIEVARDKGAFQDAGARFDAAIVMISEWFLSHEVLYPLTLLAGVVAGMWADAFLRHREPAGALKRASPLIDRINSRSQAGTLGPPDQGYDLVSGTPPLIITGTQSDNGTDVRVSLVLKNRGQTAIWMRGRAAFCEVAGRKPPKRIGSLSLPFGPGKTQVSEMGTVRLYEGSADRLGRVALSILFGADEKTARTTVTFDFKFRIISDPTKAGSPEKLEYEIVEDSTKYVSNES